MTAAILFLLSWPLVSTATAQYTHTATETHMFSLPISPNMFNWTYQEFDQQYRFHAALLGKPELPSWLRYVYSGRHHAGFVFGTPPRGVSSPITLEVIGLNRQDYETRRIQIKLVVEQQKEEEMARNLLQLKIDNLNVEDLLDQHRMERLLEIFTAKLWPDSAGHIYPTFLASAVDMGARLPLRPNEGEGLVVRLGSPRPFSAELRHLRDEVRPLSRLASCPREFKRTTVERLFRLATFTLDWCSFKLYEVKYAEASAELSEILDEPQTKPSEKPDQGYEMLQQHSAGPLRESVRPRSYVRELLAAVLLPLLLMLLPASALTVSLCCHYVGVSDELYFESLFLLCEEFSNQTRAQKPSKVEMCRYENQQEKPDNAGTKSSGVSPNNSLVRPYSPKSSTNLAGSYNRPQPPPYLGSSANIIRKSSPSTSSQSPEHNRTLEESLKLLNEAKIGADNDFNPIFGDLRKSKSGMDIDLHPNIPELNKRLTDRNVALTLDSDLLKKSTSTIDNVRQNLTGDVSTDKSANRQILDRADGMEDYVPIKPDGYMAMKPDSGYVTMKPFCFGNNLTGKAI